MRPSSNTLSPSAVLPLVSSVLATSDLHPQQVASLTDAVIGAMYADRAGVAAIGRAMAKALRKSSKHAIKQFDRLLSNEAIDHEGGFKALIGFVLGHRAEIVLCLDWTEYAEDGHHRIALSLVTKHGRSTPVLWKTVEASSLANHRNDYEDELLRQLRRLLPNWVKSVTILADRGFGDVELYEMLKHELCFDFIIRFRRAITIETAEGESGPANDFVPCNGRARLLRDAKITQERVLVSAVVLVKARAMKEPWVLATSRREDAKYIVALYGRRFTIEENFRDEKDRRFGLGLLEVRIARTDRRDRMLQVLALATAFLTLLGAAGEKLGLDRQLRANTVRRRTHSMFRQGREYIAGAVGRAADAARRLLASFRALVARQPHVRAVFGEI